MERAWPGMTVPPVSSGSPCKEHRAFGVEPGLCRFCLLQTVWPWSCPGLSVPTCKQGQDRSQMVIWSRVRGVSEVEDLPTIVGSANCRAALVLGTRAFRESLLLPKLCPALALSLPPCAGAHAHTHTHPHHSPQSSSCRLHTFPLLSWSPISSSPFRSNSP